MPLRQDTSNAEDARRQKQASPASPANLHNIPSGITLQELLRSPESDSTLCTRIFHDRMSYSGPDLLEKLEREFAESKAANL